MNSSPTTTDFLDRLAAAVADGSFLGLTLSRRIGKGDQPRRQTVRPLNLRGALHHQWTLQHKRQQTHQNLTPDESVTRIGQLLGEGYRNAHLLTATADLAVSIDRQGGCKLVETPPSRSAGNQPVEHDRVKNYLIPEGTPCPFLEELGVMTADGRVRKSRHDKFRQINRYLEFVEDIYDQLPAEGPLEVVDFGCGLSYLTFALHHLLSVNHGREVHILGIDQNPQVIDRCGQTAARLQLTGLEFVCGSIDRLPAGRTSAHLAVSLHACDTATDDALAAAIGMGAGVILAAPCCQHELFTQLESDPLALLTQHGILKERFAALATDALRAAVLERAGYRTQVIEFIETEHTPKNLLLRAVRRRQGETDPDLDQRITDLKHLLGVQRTRLETRLSVGEPRT